MFVCVGVWVNFNTLLYDKNKVHDCDFFFSTLLDQTKWLFWKTENHRGKLVPFLWIMMKIYQLGWVIINPLLTFLVSHITKPMMSVTVMKYIRLAFIGDLWLLVSFKHLSISVWSPSSHLVPWRVFFVCLFCSEKFQFL